MQIPDALEQMQKTVTGRLKKVRRRMRAQLVVEGFAWLLLLAVALAVFSFVVDWKFELSRLARMLFVAGSCIGFFYVIVQKILAPLISNWGIMDVAGAIDYHGFSTVRHAISPKVASLFQLRDEASGEFSAELSAEAARQSFDTLQNIDFENRINRRHRRNSWIGVLAGLALPIVLLLILPNALSQAWIGRWLQLAEIPWPRNTQITIVGLQDGNLIVPRGEPKDVLFEIANQRGLPPDRIRLEIRYKDQRPKRMTVLRDAAGKFKQELAGMRDVAALRIWAGDARLGPVDVVPIDRPRLVDVRLRHQHPWDDEPHIHDFDRGDGAISLLPKTKAELILKSNVGIKDLQAEWNLQESPLMEKIGEQEFLARWEHSQDAQLKVQLVGEQSGLMSPYRLVSIGLKRDRAPSITMRPQGVRRRVTPSATIPLQLAARDDFGISTLNLFSVLEKAKSTDVGDNDKQDLSNSKEDAQRKDSKEVVINLFGPVEPANERLLELEHRYSLTSADLQPGDMIRMKTKAADACFTGEQSSETPWLTFSIVKPQELFREILIRQQQLRSRLRKATDRATDLRDTITTAQFPKEGRPIVRDHRLIQRDVATVHKGLFATVREMELNELGGPEAIELIQKNVLSPLRRLTEQEMDQQRSSLESLARGGNASQSEAIDRQEKIVNDLKAVLKNMAQWDSFVDVVNQLDTVIKLQNKLKDTTEDLRAKDVESVFED